LEEELEQGVVAALRGGALDLGAVGVGFGLLGAVDLAGAAVDGVAARAPSPSLSKNARQRANTMGTWSTRTVCTLSTRNASCSA
jgi:hypothetical protein